MIQKQHLEDLEQGPVEAYTLDNGRGIRATVLTLGGVLQKLEVHGVDVVLGYDTPEEYRQNNGYFGAIIGRVANRIAGAEMTVDAARYPLTPNRPPHTLHGGERGFDRRLWQARVEGDALCLALTSPDGEEGFPGKLEVTVTYSLTEDGLRLDYRGVPDRKTPVNLTNHAYFNLNGAGDVLDHRLWVNATRYTAVDPQGIPTGQLPEVAGTFLDYRTPKALAPGLDHNFCLEGSGLRRVARVTGEMLTMTVETDCPGMQVYCAELKKLRRGKNGRGYLGPCFFCLETQEYPDAVHHGHFPNIMVGPGEEYRRTTVYRFEKR